MACKEGSTIFCRAFSVFSLWYSLWQEVAQPFPFFSLPCNSHEEQHPCWPVGSDCYPRWLPRLPVLLSHLAVAFWHWAVCANPWVAKPLFFFFFQKFYQRNLIVSCSVSSDMKQFGTYLGCNLCGIVAVEWVACAETWAKQARTLWCLWALIRSLLNAFRPSLVCASLDLGQPLNVWLRGGKKSLAEVCGW